MPILTDLAAMRRLYEVGNLCVRAGNDLQHCLDVIVEAAVMLMGADKGNLQIFDAKTGALRIAAQLNFQAPFLQFFAVVGRDDTSICSAAMQWDRRVVVEDITKSLFFSGQESQSVLLEAGVRAVQSTPLLSGSGQLLGIISTHFAVPFRYHREKGFDVVSIFHELYFLSPSLHVAFKYTMGVSSGESKLIL